MLPRRIPGLAELAGRGTQRLAAMCDQHGLLPWGAPPPGDAARLRPELPAPTLTPSAAAALDTEAVRARADLVLAGRYPLLGHAHGHAEPLHWGAVPDWHRDMLSGRVAPRLHWSQVPYLDVNAVGDHKITWELNRHQWMLWLAQAAALTGEARYSDALWQRLAHWLEHNPRGQGINWASSLEVAFRAIAWTYTLHIAPSPPPAALATSLASALHAHGRHVERWLSHWFSPNTHLTGEALGLLTLGVAFPWLPRAATWRALAWRILCTEATVQIRPDGTYFEQTGWYQAYTVDFYLEALALAEQARLEVPEVVRGRTHAAARALAAMTHANGTVVRFGDDDGGRLLPLATGSYGDVRDTLAWAAVTFADASLLRGLGDCSSGPAAQGVAWRRGDAGLRALHALAAGLSENSSDRNVSAWLPDGGWVALRGAQIAVYMDAGPHSALSGAHAHADALAIEVSVHGRTVLADPGTFQYMGDGRDRLRATMAHNALTVGDASSATPGGPFRWTRVPTTCVTGTRLHGSEQVAQAWHDGFGTLVRTGTGRSWRELRLLHDQALLVFDWFDGEPIEPLRLHWRPPVGVRAVVEQHRILLLDDTVSSDRAHVLATIVIPPEWHADITMQGYSPGYAVCANVTGVTCTPVQAEVRACCALVVPGLASSDVSVRSVEPLSPDHAARGWPSWRVVLYQRDDIVTPTSFS